MGSTSPGTWPASSRNTRTVVACGSSTLIVGYGDDTLPKLYNTDPSGTFYNWKATCIGRNSKTVQDFLEKNWKEELDDEAAVRLALKALLEVVEAGKNLDVLIVSSAAGQPRGPRFLEESQIAPIIEAIREESQAK